MATQKLHVPQAGYKTLSGGNYYVAKFGYLSIAGATSSTPSTNSLLLLGRGSDRAMDRGME